MTTSESIAAIGAALAKAQGTIEGATKDSKNPHFNSKYADLASVVAACRQALSVNGICVLQSASNDGNLVSMRTRLVHGSGEWIESDHLTVQARDAGPQAIGSCHTYLRRFQLAAMAGVAPIEDDDAEAAEGRSVATQARPVTPQAPEAKPAPVASRGGYPPMPKPIPPPPSYPQKPAAKVEATPITADEIPFSLLLPLALALLGVFA